MKNRFSVRWRSTYLNWVKRLSAEHLESELDFHQIHLRYFHTSARMRKENPVELQWKIAQKRKMFLAAIDAMELEKRAEAYKMMEEAYFEQLVAVGPLELGRRVELIVNITALRLALQARKTRELLKPVADSASAPAHRLHKTTVLAARRNVVLRNAALGAQRMCAQLDLEKISLPEGEEWDSFRSHKEPWTSAYRTGGEKFRRRIRVIFAKDRNA